MFIMIVIRNFLFNFITFCVIVTFLTNLLTLGILFLTVVRAVVLARSVILGIFTLTSFLLPLRTSVVAKLVILGISVAKLVISGILSSIVFILALYTSF